MAVSQADTATGGAAAIEKKGRGHSRCPRPLLGRHDLVGGCSPLVVPDFDASQTGLGLTDAFSGFGPLVSGTVPWLVCAAFGALAFEEAPALVGG